MIQYSRYLYKIIDYVGILTGLILIILISVAIGRSLSFLTATHGTEIPISVILPSSTLTPGFVSFNKNPNTTIYLNSSKKEFFGMRGNLELEEAGSMGESPSVDWWLNSGGYFIVENGIGKTIMGNLDNDDYWRKRYESANPKDTDNGNHPQNIFRLVTRSTWRNSDQEVYFKISRYRESLSPNRDGYNGVLLMNRYIDGNNLYYAGLRVDGLAVIKKKINGRYFLLAAKPVYRGVFDREINPNLIPTDTWIGIKTEVRDNLNGSVKISLLIDKNSDGAWEPVLYATDVSRKYGPSISEKAFAGIRTDFMDVSFRGYAIKEI